MPIGMQIYFSISFPTSSLSFSLSLCLLPNLAALGKSNSLEESRFRASSAWYRPPFLLSLHTDSSRHVVNHRRQRQALPSQFSGRPFNVFCFLSVPPFRVELLLLLLLLSAWIWLSRWQRRLFHPFIYLTAGRKPNIN